MSLALPSICPVLSFLSWISNQGEKLLQVCLANAAVSNFYSLCFSFRGGPLYYFVCWDSLNRPTKEVINQLFSFEESIFVGAEREELIRNDPDKSELIFTKEVIFWQRERIGERTDISVPGTWTSKRGNKSLFLNGFLQSRYSWKVLVQL